MKFGKEVVYSKPAVEAWERIHRPELHTAPARGKDEVRWDLLRTTFLLKQEMGEKPAPWAIRFNYKKLQTDLGFLATDIPRLFQSFFGEQISKGAVYAWFARESMTVERLVQLLTVVRLETGRKLDAWDYIDPHS
jgi:hypothetical protein